MAQKAIRLNKLAKEDNISVERIVEFLQQNGTEVDSNPNTKITDSKALELLEKEFSTDKNRRVESQEISEEQRKEKEAIRQQQLEKEKKEREKKEQKELEIIRAKANVPGVKTIGKIDLNTQKESEPAPKQEQPAPEPTQPINPSLIYTSTSPRD